MTNREEKQTYIYIYVYMYVYICIYMLYGGIPGHPKCPTQIGPYETCLAKGPLSLGAAEVPSRLVSIARDQLIGPSTRT